MAAPAQRTVGLVLFPGFELLDACGPAEFFGNLKGQLEVVTLALGGESVASTQGTRLAVDAALDGGPATDWLLVPGGIGTRAGVDDAALIQAIARRAESAELVMTVCTGAALLARTGLLDGRRATSNKRSFSWVVEQGPKVEWVKKARWVEDGRFWTSSGVSAGMDMALAVIERTFGGELATVLANAAEYERHTDPSWDPFAR